MKTGSSKNKYILMLALTSFIWGSAFVAQDIGSEYIGAYSFTGIRFLIGAFVLLPVILIRKYTGKRGLPAETVGDKNSQTVFSKYPLITGGIVCGILLCLASNLQQIGIAVGSSVGKASFLTSTYIVLVPILEYSVFKHRVRMNIWIAVVLAMAGLYLMCMSGTETIEKGDAFILGCAISFAFQILALSYFAPKCDPLELSCLEFTVCGVISCVIMCFTDIRALGLNEWLNTITLQPALIALLYAGVFSSGVAYTLQVVAEKDLQASVASLIFSTESIFAALSALVILGQRMSTREIMGSVLIFSAVIVSAWSKEIKDDKTKAVKAAEPKIKEGLG
ncbi:MAG: DMT family transporter [Lachnospiraceae bacterium]|nr:DMT family transporter [Lachnospiraceae bacterium]